MSNKPFWKKVRKRTRVPRHYALYLLVVSLSWLVRRLPMRAGLALGGMLGRLAWIVVFWERHRALENLRRVFSGEKSEGEIRAIGRGVFRNAGYSLVEMIHGPYLDDAYLTSHITIQGFDKVAHLVDSPRGVIGMSAHFGNWELMGSYLARVTRLPIVTIFRRLSNPYLNRLLEAQRDRLGFKVIERGTSGIPILRSLRQGNIVCILGDQDTRGEGIFVDFLGKPAFTQIGISLLALKLTIPIVPTFLVRSSEDPSHHTLYVEPALSFELTGDRDTDIRVVTQLFTNTIEKYIRKFPDQWMWFHRRWKTQPPGDNKAEGSKTINPPLS